MARSVHTLDLEVHTFTSQKFNGVRELVTILHCEIRARLDQVELYTCLGLWLRSACIPSSRSQFPAYFNKSKPIIFPAVPGSGGTWLFISSSSISSFFGVTRIE